MKKCIKCNIEKDESEFYSNKANKDGLNGKCKLCTKEAVSLYREKNLDIVKQKVNNYRKKHLDKASEYSKTWRKENKEYKKQKDKEYCELNKDKLKEKKKKYYFNNIELIREKKKKYRLDNIDIIREKDREYAKLNKNRRNQRHHNRMKNDIIYYMYNIVRSVINDSFRRSRYTKKSRTYEILGCSFEEFKIYLESKFEPWMNWENRGLYNGELNYGWDIDHIIPLSSAKSEEEVYKLNYYSNLQPLCSYTNRYIKVDKIIN